MRRSSLAQMWMLPIVIACSDPPDRVTEGGWLEASWTGADSGRIAAPATAEWCEERRVLEIRAIRGDTGVALAFHVVDTIEADTYSVVPPERADTQPPSASAALRVFSTTAIQGYQSDSGTVVLKRSGSGELSGTVEVSARSVANGQQLMITGEMGDLLMVPQVRGCGPETAADSADSSAESSGADVD